jgi:hypothetical protein
MIERHSSSHKVTAAHLSRKAVVYLRQSSPKQVRENLESQRRATTPWAPSSGTAGIAATWPGKAGGTSTETSWRSCARSQVTYRDGRSETIGSDAGWKASTGPILMSEIYHGETYDARREKDGWTTAGFNDGAWSGVRVADDRKGHLVAPDGPPVRRIEELRPVKIFETPGGDTVADLGQNMVGWVRLKAPRRPPMPGRSKPLPRGSVRAPSSCWTSVP